MIDESPSPCRKTSGVASCLPGHWTAMRSSSMVMWSIAGFMGRRLLWYAWSTGSSIHRIRKSPGETVSPGLFPGARVFSVRQLDADRAVPAGAVVRGVQAADDDTGFLVLGVDELVAADVETDVGQACGVGVLEEDQVTRLQVGAGDGRARRHLGPGARADVLAHDVLDDPVGEAGAVEARRAVRRPHVRVAKVVHRVADERVARSRSAARVGRVRRRGRVAGATALGKLGVRLDQVVGAHEALEAIVVHRVEAV